MKLDPFYIAICIYGSYGEFVPGNWELFTVCPPAWLCDL